MTDLKPTRRIDPIEDGLRVVKSVHELYGTYPDGRQNALTQEYEDLFTVTPPKKGGPDRVRVGTAAHVGDCKGWQIHGVDLTQRVCDRCADMRAEYEDGFPCYTPDNEIYLVKTLLVVISNNYVQINFLT